MSEEKDDIDWSVTTWEGSRRAQLRQAFKLTLRERMKAVEGMGQCGAPASEDAGAGEVQGGRQ